MIFFPKLRGENSKKCLKPTPRFSSQIPFFPHQFVDPPRWQGKLLLDVNGPSICLADKWPVRTETYCWWFRNPAITSCMRGSLSARYLQGFIHPTGGCLGFLPSTVPPWNLTNFPHENRCLDDELLFFWNGPFSGAMFIRVNLLNSTKTSSKWVNNPLNVHCWGHVNTLQWIPCPWSSTRPAIQVMWKKALNRDVILVLIVEHGVYCQIATGWPHLQNGITYVMKMTWICLFNARKKYKHILPNDDLGW